MDTKVKIGIGVGAVVVVGGVGYWLYRRSKPTAGSLAHPAPGDPRFAQPGAQQHGAQQPGFPPPPPPQREAFLAALAQPGAVGPGIAPSTPGYVPPATQPGGGGGYPGSDIYNQGKDIYNQGKDIYNQGKDIYNQGQGIWGTVSASIPGGLPGGGSLPGLGSIPGLGGGGSTPDFGSALPGPDDPPRPVYNESDSGESDSGSSSEWTGAAGPVARPTTTWRELRHAIGVRV